MSKKTLFLVVFLLIGRALPLQAADFLLFYSNDTHGETEPCGCKSRQLGGLARQALQITQLTEREKLPALFLSGGGLLFKQSSIQAGQEMQEQINAEGIAEAMQAMNCRAIGLEAHDLSGGVALLKKMQQQQKNAWLSMNVVDTKKQPVFSPYLLTEIAGVQTAVLGLTGSIDTAPDKADYTLLSWKDTLPKALAQVKDKAALIILLSSYPYEVNKEIAEAHPSIHLILASGPAAAATYPFMVGQTLFAQTGARGKTLGMMRVTWTETGRWEESDLSKIRMEQNRLDQINLELTRLEQQPDGDKDRQRLMAEKQNRTANITKLRNTKRPEGENPCRFSNDFIALESSLPEDRKVAEIMARAKQRLTALNQERSEKVERAAALSTLAGWESCAKCHAPQTAFWQKSRHANSLQALEKKQQQLNENCLLCHVTLPYYDSARVKKEQLLLQLPEQHRRVSCESCHGPAVGHVSNPALSVPVPKPTAHVCLGCHTPEHDGHFIFAEKAKIIRCPQR